MLPFGGHTPIHPRWSEYHRPVATGGQTATCTITRNNGTGTLDGDGVWHPPATTLIYAGTCRVTPQSPAGPIVVGEQPVAVGGYQVTVEWDVAEIREHDMVTVLTAKDPGLVGKQLRVTDANAASEAFERALTCTQDITHREA